jgi:nicotinamidase/pyrazinamidase
LQQTPGAQLHPALDVPLAECILRKGFRPHIDSYSAFLENDHTTPTGLAGYLRERNLTRLFFCGLAYDFCVRFSAIDGKRLGFETIVIEDACRAVNLPSAAGLSGSVEATNTSLAAANIPRIQSTDVLTR